MILQRAHILIQGSDVDLGLPLVADNASKARRRPLDIVEQSEQPRVCFQVAAAARRRNAALVVACSRQVSSTQRTSVWGWNADSGV